MIGQRLSYALAAVLTACASSGGSLPNDSARTTSEVASVSPASCTQNDANVPVPSSPHGLMVWIDSIDETKNQPAILKYLPSDPNLCGASIVVLWSSIDRGPQASPQYDFDAIDKAARPWIRAGKTVNFLFAGVNEVGPNDTATPAWVLAQKGANKVDVVSCKDPGSASAVGPPTPVYWERGYHRPYLAFISHVIARYAGDRHVGYMRFGLGAGAEDFPQHGADGNCFSSWQKYGLSAKFWATFSSGLTGDIAARTRTYSSRVTQLVAINPFDDPSAPFPVAGTVANAAAADGVGFGTENLGSGNYGSKVEACSKDQTMPYWCSAFEAHAGSVPLEFQPITYTLNPSNATIAPLPKLLPYAIYNHAQIFELYPQEWLTADDPAFPTYAAHHAAWRAALEHASAVLGRSGV